MIKNIAGAIWIGVSQLVLLAANFLLLRLMTSHLSVGSFGFYSLCMTIVLFARQVIYDPISIVAAKECASSAHNPRRLSYGLRIVRLVTDRLALSFLFLGVLTCFFAYAVIKNADMGIIVWSCFVYLFANGAQGIYSNVLNSISDRKAAALFSMLDSVLKLLLVFLVLHFFDNEVASTLLSIAVGAFSVFLAVRLFIKNRNIFGELSPKRRNGLVRRSLIMSVPLLLPSVLAAFKSVIDRWVLVAFVGVDDLAVYSVLLQLGYLPMMLFVGVIQTFVAPRIYGLCGLKGGAGFVELKQFVYKIVFWVFILSCTAVGLAIVLSDLIFYLLVGEVYRLFSTYLPLFVCSGALAAVAGILHLTVIGVFPTRVVGKLMITSVVLSVVAALTLIVCLGFLGAVISLVVASAVTVLIYWVALKNGPFRRYS